MKATIEEMKQEAIKRMNIIQLFPTIIKEFEKDNIVNLSDRGYLYWLTDEQKEYVSDFEQKNEVIVYHIIQSYTNLGEMLTFLFVSKDKDEWEYDENDLKEGYPFAYVKNLNDDNCSEFGSVGIEYRYGGLIRTA